MKSIALLLISGTLCFGGLNEALWEDVPGGGQWTVLHSSHSMFPHPDRMEGHQYGDSLYSFAEHYNDSSVVLYLPPGFRATETIDLVYYFHGWGNNTAKSIRKFKLFEQWQASGKNAVFVFPEGPRNAPDSFGGKLEEPGRFKKLTAQVIRRLQTDSIIAPGTGPGQIILAGHSGAYRVMAYIIDVGGLTGRISEVYLFDALYAKIDVYRNWLESSKGKLADITTPNGGTWQNSIALLDTLKQNKVPYYRLEGETLDMQTIGQNRVLFWFTDLKT